MPATTVNIPLPVYGAVPPVAVTFMVAVPPLQEIGLVIEAVAASAESGCVIVIIPEATQPLTSFT